MSFMASAARLAKHSSQPIGMSTGASSTETRRGEYAMKNAKKVIVTGIAAWMFGIGSLAAKAPLQGTLKTTETDTFAYPNVIVDGTGEGVATLLGRFTMTFHVAVDLTTASGPASATLIAANGDTIAAQGTGQADDQGSTIRITEEYVVTGGTGRFVDASGSFTIVRVYDPVTGNSTGQIDGTLDVK
jgi:hypothetical protein